MWGMTRADKWLIGILLVSAAGGIGLNLSIMGHGAAQTAHISKDGQEVKSIALKKGYRQEIRIGGESHFNLIEADNGRIHIKDADCPDRLCVRDGWILVAPQQLVCLPHRVMIRIQSDEPTDLDEITR